ncbi:hypothetical protein Glove_166g117 [Diversispora epigaea]|uniref:Uncharacterized protein n=1 Tax=Diversispora epigaea TaxID=1348612 RepID=A0A397IVA9_9GLOM|nr:hypothetical protein Glove_166g117 [Diversispora epigaea]
MAPLRAIQLHHYWNVLHYTSQDEIDKGIIFLSINKSDPKEFFAALHNLDEECLEKLNLESERLREIILLIFGINVWFLNMNVMNSPRAYKKRNILITFKRSISSTRIIF